jgi:hypothetical protein
MRSAERTAVLVSRISMLSICTATECTTIVFGQGTCVEHDEHYLNGVDTPPAEAGSEQHAEVAEALSRVT